MDQVVLLFPLLLRVPATSNVPFRHAVTLEGEERNFRVVAGTGIQSVWLSQLLKSPGPHPPCQTEGGVSAKNQLNVPRESGGDGHRSKAK